MKQAGGVKSIDDLGRVVIPKEIRKTLQIKEGESFLPYWYILETFKKKIKVSNRVETIWHIKNKMIKNI